jgi:hypothetical protein
MTDDDFSKISRKAFEHAGAAAAGLVAAAIAGRSW